MGWVDIVVWDKGESIFLVNILSIGGCELLIRDLDVSRGKRSGDFIVVVGGRERGKALAEALKRLE